MCRARPRTQAAVPYQPTRRPYKGCGAQRRSRPLARRVGQRTRRAPNPVLVRFRFDVARSGIVLSWCVLLLFDSPVPGRDP